MACELLVKYGFNLCYIDIWFWLMLLVEGDMMVAKIWSPPSLNRKQKMHLQDKKKKKKKKLVKKGSY